MEPRLRAGHRTRRRNACASLAGKGARAIPGCVSCVLQPALACADDSIEIRELVAKALTAGSGDGVGLASVLCSRSDRTNPAVFFEARDGAVQGSGAEANAGEALDIHHHGVAVFIAAGEAREDEKCGIRHEYYASRTISYGVVGRVSS